jgi:hypothetical protein
MRTLLGVGLVMLASCTHPSTSSLGARLPYVRESFTLPKVLARTVLHTKGCAEVSIDGWQVDAVCDGVRLHFVQRPGELRFGCEGVDKDACMLLAKRVVGEETHGRHALDEDMSDYGGGGYYGDMDMGDPYGGGYYGGMGYGGGGTHLNDSGFDPDDPSATVINHDYVVFKDKAMPEQSTVRITAIASSDPAYKDRKKLVGSECQVVNLRKTAGSSAYAGILDCAGVKRTFTGVDVDLAGNLVSITEVGQGDAFIHDRDALVGRECVQGPIEATDGSGFMRAALYCDGAYLYFAEVKFTVIGKI